MTTGRINQITTSSLEQSTGTPTVHSRIFTSGADTTRQATFKTLPFPTGTFLCHRPSRVSLRSTTACKPLCNGTHTHRCWPLPAIELSREYYMRLAPNSYASPSVRRRCNRGQNRFRCFNAGKQTTRTTRNPSPTPHLASRSAHGHSRIQRHLTASNSLFVSPLAYPTYIGHILVQHCKVLLCLFPGDSMASGFVSPGHIYRSYFGSTLQSFTLSLPRRLNGQWLRIPRPYI